MYSVGIYVPTYIICRELHAYLLNGVVYRYVFVRSRVCAYINRYSQNEYYWLIPFARPAAPKSLVDVTAGRLVVGGERVWEVGRGGAESYSGKVISQHGFLFALPAPTPNRPVTDLSRHFRSPPRPPLERLHDRHRSQKHRSEYARDRPLQPQPYIPPAPCRRRLVTKFPIGSALEEKTRWILLGQI